MKNENEEIKRDINELYRYSNANDAAQRILEIFGKVRSLREWYTDIIDNPAFMGICVAILDDLDEKAIDWITTFAKTMPKEIRRVFVDKLPNYSRHSWTYPSASLISSLIENSDKNKSKIKER